MVTITPEHRVTTLINVFMVEPENQQRLVDLLLEATNQTIKHLPGFISASIHKSADGVRVTNYAQWRSREDLQAMLQAPEAQPHLMSIMEIAQSDAHLYDVVEAVSMP